MSRASESGGEVGLSDPIAQRDGSLSNLDVRGNCTTVTSLAFGLGRGVQGCSVLLSTGQRRCLNWFIWLLELVKVLGRYLVLDLIRQNNNVYII